MSTLRSGLTRCPEHSEMIKLGRKARDAGSAVDCVGLGWRMWAVISAGGGVIVRYGARGIGGNRDILAVAGVRFYTSAGIAFRTQQKCGYGEKRVGSNGYHPMTGEAGPVRRVAPLPLARHLVSAADLYRTT
jgi:hypothetical protein